MPNAPQSLLSPYQQLLLVAERRRADALARKHESVSPEPGSEVKDRTRFGTSNAPGSELQQDQPAKLTIVKGSRSLEPGSELTSAPGSGLAGPRQHISPALRFQVLKRDGFKCVYCGRSSEVASLAVDYKSSASGAGTASEGDLVAVCSDCNTGRGPVLASSVLAPPGRFKVRPMVLAQDAHNNAEQRLYLALWSRAVPKDDVSRTITIGIVSMGRLASMGETMARQNIRSLAQKLALEEIGGYDCTSGAGKTYRIFNYAEILRRRAQAGLTHYMRKTSAVVFVDPATGLPAESWPVPGGQCIAEPGSAAEQTAKTEPGSELEHKANTEPGSGLGAGNTEPGSELPRSSEPPPGSELGSASLFRKKEEKGGTSSSSVVVAAALRKFAPTADDDAVNLLVKNCQSVAKDATGDEIAYFTRLKAEQAINSRRVRNLVGFLLGAVPKCMAGSLLQDYRAAIRQEQDHDRAAWKLILDDPDQPEELKQHAREALTRLGEQA